MNKCIYLKKSNLKFNSREHVIPAGIGGINELPQGYVSHEVNNLFSGKELKALRETFVGGVRMFLGPGKRGRMMGVTKEGYITCSRKYSPNGVTLLKRREDNKAEIDLRFKYKIGFMNNRHTVFLPQIALTFDNLLNITGRFYYPGGYCNEYNNVGSFVEGLKTINPDAVKQVSTEFAVENSCFIIGRFYNDIYYYSNVPFVGIDRLLRISNENNDIPIEIILDIGDIKYDFSVRFDGGFIDGSFQFIHLKTAFNVLAFKMGQEYILDERFDRVRNIIIGKEYRDLLQTSNNDMINEWIHNRKEDDPHIIIIYVEDGTLFAYVSFYGDMIYMFEMAKALNKDVSFAYICDWRNRHESFEDVMF